MKQQTIDGLREFVAEGGGHYFLTPAEAADVIALYEDAQKSIAEEREACAQIADEKEIGSMLAGVTARAIRARGDAGA